jgi:hypothetical protein
MLPNAHTAAAPLSNAYWPPIPWRSPGNWRVVASMSTALRWINVLAAGALTPTEEGKAKIERCTKKGIDLFLEHLP